MNWKKKLFQNKKVTIMGLGLHGGGVEAAKFFSKQGAKVIVTDLKTRNQLKESLQKLKKIPGLKFVLARHRKEDFSKADLIVKNPAVLSNSPYLRIAKKQGIPIKTDIEIFFDLVSPKQVIGITGSKGKSTVATLSYLFLKTKFSDVILAGNIGVSPLKFVSKINKKTKIVLELSSFELENLKKSPHIAIITSLFPDHLNRYRNFREYIKAKEAIYKYQKKNDILILNSKSLEMKKIASKSQARVYFFNSPSSLKNISLLLSKKKKGLGESKKGKKREKFLTSCQDDNILAAVALARIFRIPQKNIKKVLSNFKGVAHRQELVALKKGIGYINDTTATTPQSTILAINTFKTRFPEGRIILIAGGEDKNLNYQRLGKKIREEVNFLILLPGSASGKIKKSLGRFDNFFLAKSMKEAVKKAAKYAKKGDIVLLSPGAASFTPHFQKRKKGSALSTQKESRGGNLFKNEFDRGRQFIELVKQLP